MAKMMPIEDGQTLLRAAGYKGAIDGIVGRGTMAAVYQTERLFASKYDFDPEPHGKMRRFWAAAQAWLDHEGFEPGVIDGWLGHNTNNAAAAWRARKAGLPKVTVTRRGLAKRPGLVGFEDLPNQRDVKRVYGDPAKGEVARRLVNMPTPVPLRVDWNLRQTVRTIRVHEDCADSLRAALVAVWDHYGEDEARRLGIDRYAGAYMHRKMRGGSKWSMHAYGCAIDFYAAPNGLRTRCPQALFCKPEYRAFLDTMQAHGWLPAIRLWGADAMHFQRARL